MCEKGKSLEMFLEQSKRMALVDKEKSKQKDLYDGLNVVTEIKLAELRSLEHLERINEEETAKNVYIGYADG